MKPVTSFVWLKTRQVANAGALQELISAIQRAGRTYEHLNLQRMVRAGRCSKSNESTVNPKADPSHQLHWLLCLGSLSGKKRCMLCDVMVITVYHQYTMNMAFRLYYTICIDIEKVYMIFYTVHFNMLMYTSHSPLSKVFFSNLLIYSKLFIMPSTLLSCRAH